MKVNYKVLDSEWSSKTKGKKIVIRRILMKVVLQRVSKAEVQVGECVSGSIKNGLLIYLGISKNDTDKDASYLVDKIVNLRIFEDDNCKMNLSLLDIKGELLIVSQFTLYADCSKGKRPNFMNAASPDSAEKLYEAFICLCKDKNIKFQTGIFGASMKVNSINSGPVTIILESKQI
jgi:D-tyrosyl-tRNA(Tyr) deacylase